MLYSPSFRSPLYHIIGRLYHVSASVSPERRPRSVRIILWVLLGLVVLWCSVCTYRAFGTLVHGRAFLQDLQALWEMRSDEQGLSPEQVRTARTHAGYLGAELSGLQRWASPPICALGRFLGESAAGRYAQLGCDGLGLGSGLMGPVTGALAAMDDAAVQDDVGMPDQLQAALRYFATDREHLLSLLPAAERLDENVAVLPRLPEKVRLLGTLAPGAVNALLLGPELFGGDQTRVYLAILQNTDELRPTGGFIGSLASLAFRGTELVSLQYLNSYDVESERAQMPPAPGPLAKYMSAPGLVFRDANWSPDFPTSAAVLGAIYSGSRGPVDGMVAMDSVLLVRVLDAIGPVPVPRYSLTVTGENLVAVSEQYWENPLEGAPLSGRAADLQGWLEHRKDFGGDFIDAARGHLGNQGIEVWLRLAETLLFSLKDRHLQFWTLTSSVAQEDLSRAGWSGEVLSHPGDYLMVVDANVGFNKVDRRIERRIAYSLELPSGDPVVTLSLTYTNTSTADLDVCIHEAQIYDSYQELTEQCYWNYVRVFVPRGAELLEARGSNYTIDKGVEAGRASFGTMVVVAPGKTAQLDFVYRLPGEALVCDRGSCHYSLTVQKQPGTIATPFQLGTDPDLSQVSISGDYTARGPLRVVETDLALDRHFTLFWDTGSD